MRASRAWASAIAAAFLAVAAMSGCSGEPSPAETTPPTLPDPHFVIDQDFPDPDVMRVGTTYYAYATNRPGANIQFATSTNLTKWDVSTSDALPTLPSWAAPGKTWAPDVSEFSPGHFVMYFVAASATKTQQCIGVATSDSPKGPFEAHGDAPLLCPVDEGGAIDPSTFVDTDGTRYLVFKNDGNCCGLDTWLQIAPLTADGSALAGQPTKLIKQSEQWEGTLIEAPVLVKHADEYVLFYSANDYGSGAYAIGYAEATSLLGPYTKHGSPLLSTLSSHGRYTGPGGQDVVRGPNGHDVLVFHSWDASMAYRGMSVLPLEWKNGKPVVHP
ncbi:glycoside hydrolase family 43 protein [Microbacterium sp. STN6]|uniref:glycoside hydrolase family 43 protein n=1 Tax=Microbacterium sp. STN6 TaxID=2995588 RepID=UPI0022608412|nr:glycoside hydrolase family 43 protein [Microbacterium sp. STN6]MCX7521145.1 glycoside hydrolase family 43 protein [Microbacterium sp. STN6]